MPNREVALPRVTSQAWETEDGLRRMDRTQECPTAVLGSGIVTESWERGMVLARVAGTLGLLFLSVQGKERVSILYLFPTLLLLASSCAQLLQHLESLGHRLGLWEDVCARAHPRCTAAEG